MTIDHPIAFVTHTSEMGGAEIALSRLTNRMHTPHKVILFEDGVFRERLEQQHTAVETLSQKSDLSGIRRKINMVTALRMIPSIGALIFKLWRAIKPYPVIVAFSQKSFVITAITMMFQRKRTLIWFLNDILSPDYFSSLLIKLVVFLANRQARCVIVNSEASKEAFIAAGGNPKLVEIIYPGIDFDPFSDVAQEEIDDARQRYGDGRTVITVTGRLAEWKGQHVVIRALSLLPDAKGWIVGGALFGESAYEDELKALVRELKLEDRVHFFGHRDDVHKLLMASDVIIHSSIQAEPFGMVIVEGMCAEKPVIATKLGGALEIIDHEQNGYLVDPDNPELLADYIKASLSNPESGTLTHNAKTKAVELFSDHAMAKRFEDILANIIS